MSATLAALQVRTPRLAASQNGFVHSLNRDRPGYLTPVAHLFPFAISQMRRQGHPRQQRSDGWLNRV